jgi:DNA-binding NarL/FixJ family response regulator
VVVIDLHGRPGTVYTDDQWSLPPAGCRVVALCPQDDPPNLITALQGGLHALLTRESGTEELIAAVRTAAIGGIYVAAELFDSVVDRTTRSGAVRQSLTIREIETLKWIAEGLTHREISRRMGLTEATVSTYIKRIRHKLNVGNKAELTRRAIELGLRRTALSVRRHGEDRRPVDQERIEASCAKRRWTRHSSDNSSSPESRNYHQQLLFGKNLTAFARPHQ